MSLTIYLAVSTVFLLMLGLMWRTDSGINIVLKIICILGAVDGAVHLIANVMKG